jgi:hypothetical protein
VRVQVTDAGRFDALLFGAATRGPSDVAGDRSNGGDRVWPGRDVLLWTAVIAWAGVWGWSRADPSGISWHFFSDGARLLMHPGLPDGGLHLYAAHPELQIGPVAFLVAASLSWLPGRGALIAGQVLMTAVLPVALAILAPMLPRARRRLPLAAAALLVTPTWTVLSVRWGHLDDALASLLLCVALRAARDNRAALAGLAVGLAADAKPWAVLGLALILLLSRRSVGAVTAAATMSVAWGPFLLADPGTLAALQPAVAVSDSSMLSLLGYRGTVIPEWDRTAQLALGPLAAVAAVRCRVWPAALLCAIAVRLALDPQDLAYYAAAAVLAAAVFDLVATRSRVPWLTLITTLALWQPFVTNFPDRFSTSTGLTLWWFQHPHVVACLHLAWVVVVLALPARSLIASATR